MCLFTFFSQLLKIVTLSIQTVTVDVASISIRYKHKIRVYVFGQDTLCFNKLVSLKFQWLFLAVCVNQLSVKLYLCHTWCWT